MAGDNESFAWSLIPTWDGNRKTWERYKEDVADWLETEKLDVDYSLGARLKWKLTGTAKVYARTVSREDLRRQPLEVNAEDQAAAAARYRSRASMTRGVRNLLEHLRVSMGIQPVDRKGELQHKFYNTLKRRPDQTMTV